MELKLLGQFLFYFQLRLKKSKKYEINVQIVIDKAYFLTFFPFAHLSKRLTIYECRVSLGKFRCPENLF